MSIWKTILAVITIFVLGTVFGLVISRHFVPGPPPPPEGPARMLPLPQLDRLLDQDLSSEQKREISKILEELRSELEELRKRARPEIDRKMQEAQRQIREILTPEQQEQFDQLIKQDRPPFDRPFRP
jgi:Spy/CpxP family protein refolding chaperone